MITMRVLKLENDDFGHQQAKSDKKATYHERLSFLQVTKLATFCEGQSILLCKLD